jgi:hypothetical protein
VLASQLDDAANKTAFHELMAFWTMTFYNIFNIFKVYVISANDISARRFFICAYAHLGRKPIG